VLQCATGVQNVEKSIFPRPGVDFPDRRFFFYCLIWLELDSTISIPTDLQLNLTVSSVEASFVICWLKNAQKCLSDSTFL
jgi:hypothetical protein